jgi:nucleoid DNA-binding protein
MSLTKKKIAHSINSKIGIAKTECLKITNSFFDEIKIHLKKDNVVKLAQFGTFRVIHKDEREGRNPKTKEKATISSRNIVSFTATSALKKRINKRYL